MLQYLLCWDLGVGVGLGCQQVTFLFPKGNLQSLSFTLLYKPFLLFEHCYNSTPSCPQTWLILTLPSGLHPCIGWLPWEGTPPISCSQIVFYNFNIEIFYLHNSFSLSFTRLYVLMSKSLYSAHCHSLYPAVTNWIVCRGGVFVFVSTLKLFF